MHDIYLLYVLDSTVALELAAGSLPVDRALDQLIHHRDDGINGANELQGRISFTDVRDATRKFEMMKDGLPESHGTLL